MIDFLFDDKDTHKDRTVSSPEMFTQNNISKVIRYNIICNIIHIIHFLFLVVFNYYYNIITA